MKKNKINKMALKSETVRVIGTDTLTLAHGGATNDPNTWSPRDCPSVISPCQTVRQVGTCTAVPTQGFSCINCGEP